VLSGTARAGGDLPQADRDPDYLDKYRAHIARIGMTPETFVQIYEVPVRIQLTRVRGH
jgi:hypothetical protein